MLYFLYLSLSYHAYFIILQTRYEIETQSRCLVTESDPTPDTAETITMTEKEVTVIIMVTRLPGAPGSRSPNLAAGVGAEAETGGQ